MATNYPSGSQTFTDPSGTSLLTSPDHAGLHTDMNDTMEAVISVLGTTAGTSVLKNFSAGQFPARVNSGGTIVQTLTGGTINNTILGTPTLTLGSDATGDIFYRSSGGTVTRLGVGSNGQYLTTNGTTPSWGTVTSSAGTDGWTDATSETWSYASASSFTIAGVDKTAQYTKGTRIKLTQSSTVKYFVVTSSSFSTNTTVNFTGGTDYTLANSAISANYYSYQANPQGYPTWFNYTPTLSAASPMTYTSTSVNNARFRVNGQACHVFVDFTGTTGGTASSSLSFSLPVTIGFTNSNQPSGFSNLGDGGNQIAGFTVWSSSTVLLVRKYDGSNFGLGSNRYVAATTFYVI